MFGLRFKTMVFLFGWHCLCPARYLHTCLKIENMEKKMFGIILTALGIAGLIAAAVIFMNSKAGVQSVKQITVYAILGAIFFFTGIGLIRTTKDRSV